MSELEAEPPSDGVTLSPELLAAFAVAVQRAEKRRRILILGTLLAMLIIVGGMTLAFVIISRADPGQFIAWVLLVPPFAVGIVFWAFGRWARKA